MKYQEWKRRGKSSHRLIFQAVTAFSSSFSLVIFHAFACYFMIFSGVKSGVRVSFGCQFFFLFSRQKERGDRRESAAFSPRFARSGALGLERANAMSVLLLVFTSRTLLVRLGSAWAFFFRVCGRSKSRQDCRLSRGKWIFSHWFSAPSRFSMAFLIALSRSIVSLTALCMNHLRFRCRILPHVLWFPLFLLSVPLNWYDHKLWKQSKTLKKE